MRLLCVSDTTRSLAFSPNINSIYGNTDIILSAGDMPLESFDYMATMLSRDVYYVYGNHNLKNFSRDMKKDRFPHSPTGDINSKFYGYLMDGKCNRLKDSGLNKRRYGRYLDILVTHAPPYGMGDGEDLCHMGFKCFLSFMDRFQPRYLIHGHVHLDDYNAPRVTEYNKTKVVNVFGSYLIDDEMLGG